MSTADDGFDSLFQGPGAGERHRRVGDLVGRALQVRRDGWEQYRYVWSAGEVLAVAYALGDDGLLAEMGESGDSVLGRWAYDLYGISGGQTEDHSGYPLTRAFFAAVADRLDMI